MANLYDFLSEEPKLLWLSKPDGTPGLLYGMVGNFMPYVNMKIANMPLFKVPNEHVVQMIATITGDFCSLDMTLVDPTNFIIERMLRYALDVVGVTNLPTIMLQWGWTDGINQFGMQSWQFMEFTIESWVQTIETTQSRWTLKGFATGSFVSKVIRVPASVAMPNAIEETSIEAVINQHVKRPIKVLIAGTPLDPRYETGGFFNQPGNLMLSDLINFIVKQMISVDGGYFNYCWISEVNDTLVKQTTGEAATNSPDGNDSQVAPGSGGCLLIYDIQYLRKQRETAARQRNTEVPSEYSQFKDCITLIRWPNSDGVVKEITIGGNTEWSMAGREFTQTSVAADSSVIQTSEKSSNPNAIITQDISATETVSISGESLGQGGTTPSGQPPPATKAAILKAKRVADFASQLTFKTKGEPWFINQASLMDLLFGLLYDYRTVLQRIVAPFGSGAYQLEQAFPNLIGVDPSTLQNMKDSGLFDPENIDSPLNGLYDLQGVVHSIVGGEYTTEFQVIVSDKGESDASVSTNG